MMMIFVQVFLSFVRPSVRPSVRSVSVGKFIQICRLETEKVKLEKMRKLFR